MPSWPMESAKLFQAMPVGRLAPIIPWCNRMAGELGFEPGLHGPGPAVLQLGDSPEKSSGIGQEIFNLLPNPPIGHRHSPESSSHRTIAESRPECKPLWPYIFANSHSQLYNILTDNGKETTHLAASPTLREATTPTTIITIARSADVTDTMAPPTLPESVTEVASC